MNYKLSISYNGSNYHGWAPQPGLKTIYGELEKSIFLLFGTKPQINASGRTDAGVHAINQVINFKLDKKIDSDDLKKALNSKLPRDIRVLSCSYTFNDFHARYYAKRKTYMYIIDCSEQINPIFEKNFYQYNKHIDIEKLNKIKNLFIGKKNFLSFSTTNYEIERCYRTIFDIDIKYNNNFLVIKIVGDGFLRSMVRMIVGSFLAYSEDKMDKKEIIDLFHLPQKGKVGYKAPSCGLYLVGVDYEN